MNDYIELPTSEIELDVSNPRIARGVAYYGNKLTSEGLMKYNPQTKAYEKDLLLKQGGYNYLYAVVPYGSTSTSLYKNNNTQNNS